MESALKALSSSGATGAILAVVFALLAGTVGVLAWALKRLVESALKQQDKFSEFMDALTTSLNSIGTNCASCQSASIAAIRSAESELKAEVQHVVWAAHDKGTLETDASVSRAVGELEESITGAATSVRETLQTLENNRLRDKLARL